jgi:hypothetical protein
LVYDDVAFVIDINTNAYESYSSSFDSIIPADCREDYEMRYIGSTSSGLVGYVNCYTMNTDAGIKFSLN